MPVLQHRAEGEQLAGRPVDGVLVDARGAPVKLRLEPRVHGETVGDGHLRVDDLLHRVERDRGGHGRVVDRAVAGLGRHHGARLRRELGRFPGLGERALQLLLVVAQRRLGLLHREVAPGDQRLGVELAHRAPRFDQVVHQRLGEAGVVALVVAAAAVADHVDHDVLAERLAVGERQLAHPGDGLRVVAVHVEDRRLDHPRHVGRVDAGPRLHRRGGEADLVVHHDVHGAAGAVAAQLRQVQRLGYDALAGEGRVTVDEHGQNGEAVLRLVEDVLLGADDALGHRVDALQVAGVGDQAEAWICLPPAAVNMPCAPRWYFTSPEPWVDFGSRLPSNSLKICP